MTPVMRLFTRVMRRVLGYRTMPKERPEKEADQAVYVRLSPSIAKRLDKRVTRERKEKGGVGVTRSSVIRDAVVRMLEQESGP
jgi:hypothetical protein